MGINCLITLYPTEDKGNFNENDILYQIYPEKYLKFKRYVHQTDFPRSCNKCHMRIESSPPVNCRKIVLKFRLVAVFFWQWTLFHC